MRLRHRGNEVVGLSGLLARSESMGYSSIDLQKGPLP
jgi:hypothetical protein